MTGDLPRLAYTREEAAAVCGVSKDTIIRAHNSGALKAKRTGKKGGNYLYTPAALQAWIDGLPAA